MYLNQNGSGMELAFQPHPLVRNRHFQTIMSILSRPLRNGTSVCSAAEELILSANDVRLQGFYSPQMKRPSRGLVLVLHGWLGHAASSYVINIADCLYRCGYSVFRLNLRDHGDTYYLNPGLLYDDLLAETCAAAQQIAQLEGNRPFFVVGASMGGNFALRLTLCHDQPPIPNLAHTVVINPVINLYNATLNLDEASKLYRVYFRHRWRKFMSRKMETCPSLIDWSAILTARSLMEMTERFARYCTSYPDLMSYFADHTITPEMMLGLRSRVTMIAAADDPLIPVSDITPFQNLNSRLQVHIQPYGGHIGFIDIFPFRKWAAEAVRFVLEN